MDWSWQANFAIIDRQSRGAYFLSPTFERAASQTLNQTQANRSAILDFEVEGVDREHDHLRGMVLDWVLPPTDQPWGNRAMLFRDPDGNLVNCFAPISRAPAMRL